MTRVKRGVTSHAKHKRILNLTKGYWMKRHRLIKVAKEATLHAGEYAYAGRKQKKRIARRDWITRINGALASLNVSYHQFIFGLKKAKIGLDRKILAELVAEDFATFKKIVEMAKV